MEKIVLDHAEPSINSDSKQIAQIVMQRIGLVPRKVGSTENMYKILLELYERSKRANRQKDPKLGMLTVEEMAELADITRQTMYDYLKRWLTLDIITKSSFIGKDNKVVIGYKLNGATLESAFEKSQMRIKNNLEMTSNYIKELQKVIKNEKISEASKASK